MSEIVLSEHIKNSILKSLKEGKILSNRMAANTFHCHRLDKYIDALKEEGYIIYIKKDCYAGRQFNTFFLDKKQRIK